MDNRIYMVSIEYEWINGDINSDNFVYIANND